MFFTHNTFHFLCEFSYVLDKVSRRKSPQIKQINSNSINL